MINPSFQGVNKHFALSFEDNTVKTGHTGYILTKVEIKNLINGRNFFDEPVINNLKIYGNIWEVTIGQGVDFITGCLLYYPLF